MLKTLVIVPCGKSKIWKKHPNKGPTEARKVYTGAPFILNKRYAEHFETDWVILSAKYGFIEPDYRIPQDYNVTFNDPKSNPITIEELENQATELEEYNCIVALGGKVYSNITRKVFRDKQVVAPTYGLPIGKAMHKMKTAIESNTHLSTAPTSNKRYIHDVCVIISFF